ncbi:hypothetical protein [Paenibacillus chungangensis]|uniref:Uncharacterized protein n=1 Tax=Paenibacillus chungangensis TaxID=696535 RepID=A0ABW3HLU3_9BACL
MTIKKTPVTLRPYKRVQESYQKLKICRKCRSFTVLGERACPSCGKQTLVPVEKYAATKVTRSHWRSRALLLLLLGAGLAFADVLWESILLLVVGIALLYLLLTMQKRATPALHRIQLEKCFIRHQSGLAAGLNRDHQSAVEVFQQGDKPRTYEMLREIGSLVQNDRLRMEQIMLLQTFRLRKDMDLMLEPLLMESFNAELVAYIGEIARIRRDLIRENTFRYMLQHESQIMKLPNGNAIMALVAGAAVRKQRYMKLYPYLLLRYARLLPKERFLRLYRYVQVQGHATSSTPLRDEVMRIYEEKYKWDPDFEVQPG